MTIVTNSEAETEAVGTALVSVLPKSAVVALYGGLGAGKTAFVRGMARGLGITGVTSPTYTIVNEYVGACELFHFDMYRLSDSGELFDIGWEDYLNRDGICVVEWSENVDDIFSGGETAVTIERLSESGRRIRISQVADREETADDADTCV